MKNIPLVARAVCARLSASLLSALVKFSTLLLFLIPTLADAQLMGTKNIPGDYATISAAVSALNASGVGAGGVVFNVAAGHSEITDIPVITASGTVANPITFQKSGVGANPKIRPLTAGTIASSTTIGSNGDGIVIINGGDYFTFDGIDLETDPAFTTTGMYEYGYYTKKASGTDACKNITIRNCTITLNKAAIYSFGIFVSNISGTTSVTVTTTGGRSENFKIYNTTITNSYGGIQLRGYAASSPYDLYDQNNWVGEDGGNTITNFGGGATTVYGIYGIYQNELKANNNTISGGDNTTTTHYGIFISTCINSNLETDNNYITINNNATTSQVTGISFQTGTTTGTTNTQYVTNNSITINRTGATTGVTYFIYFTSNYPANLEVTGNDIGNSTLPGTGAIYGIYNISNPVNSLVNGNTVHDITRSGTTSTSLFYGIGWDNTTATTLSTISNNIIHSLTGNGSTGAVGGITVGTQATIDVYKNKIYNITSDNAGGVVYGITLATGVTTYNVFNNLIGDLKSPNNSSTTDAIRGINITSVTTNSNINVSYNTVYLAATSTGVNFTTTGLYHTTSATATSGTLNLRNNIIVNLSTPNGTGTANAYRRSSTTLTNYGAASDRNLFYAGTPDATHLIFYDGTNADQTLAAFKTRVSPREANSITENPTFLSLSGANSNFLHISTSVPTQIESGGSNIAGITADYDGTVRQGNGGYAGTGTAPDLGADEGEFMGVDLTAPTITYTSLGFTCLTSDRSLNGVAILDASGVPTAGANQPRIYYKKNVAGTWFSSQGTLASGTGFNGTWNFTIIVADLGGIMVGDTVYYYVIAQDNSVTPNVSANPGAGLVASGVNTVTTHPTNPNFYVIGGSLNGTYMVGTGQTYTSLTQAIIAYNGNCLTGPVVFQLTDPTYSGSESFPIVIQSHPDASSTNTLTIRPAGGIAATISGTSGATPSALIKLNGADYVIIDGINTGGSSLTIENTSTTAGTGVIWLASAGAGSGSRNNILRNLSIKAGVTQNTTATNTYGIIVAGATLNSSHTTIAAGDDNDNNTISNNTITKVRYALFIRGGSTTNPNTGTLISNNIIGPNAFGSEEIGKAGIHVREEDGIQIIDNTIRFVGGNFANTTGTGTDRLGIVAGTDATWPPTAAYLKNAIITRNIINDIVEERTFSAAGIAIGAVDGTNATNNLVANNMVFNVKANATSPDQTVGIGATGGNGDKIVYNSLYLTGDTDPDAGATTPSQSNFGISITSTSVTNPVIKDNIVYMDLTSSSAPALKNASINIPTSFVWGTGASDYNDIYYNPANPQANTACIGGNGGTFYLTLPAWQTASAQDANSIQILPVFTSSTDLHLVPGSNGVINNLGTPIAGVTTDYDNSTRNVSTPDMGMDEFDAMTGVDVGANAIVAPVNDGCFTATETVSVRIKNYAGSTLDFSVNNVTVTVTTSSGYNSNTVINSGTLASGATMTVNMPALLDMSMNLTYTFNATATSGSDFFTGNDAMTPVNMTHISLGGSYTVGAGQNYTTLTAALIAYNNMTCNTGPIVFNLTDASYASETFPLTINHNALMGSNTLTIRPNTGIAVTISAAATTALIDINGGDNIIIDGVNTGGSSLLLRNTSTTTPVIRLINDATNNTITNATIEGGVTSTTSGLILFSSSTTGTLGNSNNTISGCNLRDRTDATATFGNCIYSSGTTAAPNANNMILVNNLFNFNNSGINLSSTGLGNNWNIDNNNIYNAQGTASSAAQNGILIAAGTGHIIYSNYIGGNATGATGTWTNSGNVAVSGISLTGAVATVESNIIANINCTNVGTTQRLRGILHTGGVNGVIIQNNTVHDLKSMGAVTSFAAGSQPVTGIYCFMGSNAFFVVSVKGNVIHDISAENTTALTTTMMADGMFFTNFTGECAYNHIYNIRNKSTGVTAGQPPIATGIYVRFCSGGYFYNNMIAVGDGESNDVQTCGVVVAGVGTAGNDQYWLNNSIRVMGTSTGTFPSYGFVRGDNTATSQTEFITMRNTIISMERTAGSASNYAIASQGTTPEMLWDTDYNDLYSGVASTVGLWNMTSYNFADWQTNTGDDANSISVLPVFTGTNDLHLATSNSAMDNTGELIPDLEDDFDHDPRNVVRPDMGADEFYTGCSHTVVLLGDSGAGTLRDVIACVADGEPVFFDASLLNQTITLTSGEIVLNKSIRLEGLGKNNLTISGNNASRLFHLQTGRTLKARDQSWINGNAVANGGAILVEGALWLNNVLLDNNFENGVPKSLTLLSTGLVNVSGAVEMNQ